MLVVPDDVILVRESLKLRLLVLSEVLIKFSLSLIVSNLVADLQVTVELVGLTLIFNC